MEVLKFQFELNPAQLHEAEDHFRLQNALPIGPFAGFALLLFLPGIVLNAIIWFAILQDARGTLSAAQAITMFVAPWAYVVGLQVWLMARRRRRASQHLWRANPHLHDRFEMVFDEDGFTVWNPLCLTRYRWDAVGEVVKTDSLIMLYTTKTYVAAVIPKESLADHEGLALALSFAEHRHITPENRA